jgi:hypothetical protein
VELVRLCLAGAEDEARKLASAASAMALAKYVRQHARRPWWHGAGVRLIAIASGVGDLPRRGDDLNDPETLEDLERFRSATDSVAARIACLLGPEAQARWEATLGADDPDAGAYDDRADRVPAGFPAGSTRSLGMSRAC